MNESSDTIGDKAVRVTGPLRAVLTLAVGKSVYLEMAINLARSFSFWHRNNDIRFFVATDLTTTLPPDLKNVSVIDLKKEDVGEGFSAKLHLDKSAPADRTLFIDADCLCTGNLDFVFDRFQGSPVGVVGGSISEGEWFGDVRAICERFAVSALPKFNGGIYYIEKGDVSESVYTRARELEQQYDQLGLKRLRNRPNDELLIAIAMANHGLRAVPDDGSILSSPFECPGPFRIDAMRGSATLINPPAPDPRHQGWYPFAEVHPVLVHFLGDFHRSYQYRAEAFRLKFWRCSPVMRVAIRMWTQLFIIVPGVLWETVQAQVRPLYRRIFGVRQIRKSERV